jgi:hypothetical protein
MARRQRKRVPPALIPGPPDQSATPPPASTAARQRAQLVPWGWETDRREIPPPGRRFFSSGVQDPPAAENALVETLTGGGGNVNIPPMAEVAGAPRPDPTGAEAKAAAGTFTGEVAVGLPGAEAKSAAGELTARVEPREVDIGLSSEVTVNLIRAPDEPPEPDPDTLAASVEPLGMSRIETDCAYLLFLAISFEKMARDEIARLSSERPNDPHTIESNKRQSDLLSILADGFAKLAAALEEYSKRPQPLLAGKAKKIADEVGAQLKAWWEANAADARDWCIRLPIFTASIGALGLVGADMHFATPMVGVLVGGQKVITAIKVAKKRTKRP